MLLIKYSKYFIYYSFLFIANKSEHCQIVNVTRSTLGFLYLGTFILENNIFLLSIFDAAAYRRERRRMPSRGQQLVKTKENTYDIIMKYITKPLA